MATPIYLQVIDIQRSRRAGDVVEVEAEVANRIAVHRALLHGEPRRAHAGDGEAAIWVVTHVPSSLAIRTNDCPLMLKRTADALAAELRELPQGPEWDTANPVDPAVIAQIKPIADRYAAIAGAEWEEMQLGKWRLARRRRVADLDALQSMLTRALSDLEDEREDESFREFIDDLAEWVEGHDDPPTYPWREVRR